MWCFLIVLFRCSSHFRWASEFNGKMMKTERACQDAHLGHNLYANRTRRANDILVN